VWFATLAAHPQQHGIEQNSNSTGDGGDRKGGGQKAASSSSSTTTLIVEGATAAQAYGFIGRAWAHFWEER
jgi:hypothetical protein